MSTLMWVVRNKTGDLHQISYEQWTAGGKYIFTKVPEWIQHQSTSGGLKRAIKVYHTGRGSKAEALKAHCIDCAGSKVEVKKCPATGCPIWPVRPFQTIGTHEVPGLLSKETLKRLMDGDLEPIAVDSLQDFEEYEPPQEGEPNSTKTPAKAKKKRKIKRNRL